MTKSIWLSVLLVGSAFAVSSCGQAVPAPDGSSDNSQTPSSQNALASFGNQCPYGYVEEPTAAPVDMSDCPNAQITLAQPLEAIIVSADCSGKNLTARTSDRTVDNTFEAMPDGSFYLEMPAGTAVLSNGCQIPLVADMAGVMNCGSLTASNYDQADISIDAVWKPAPASSPTPGHAPAPAVAPGCTFPAGCMLHASTVVHQCKQ